MNLKEREKLYIEHMKLVLEKWIDDKRNYQKELSEKERYPACARITLSEHQIDSWFDESRRKLKEFYGVDDIFTAYREPKVVKEVKVKDDDDDDMMIVNIDDLGLPLKIDELLMRRLNITKLRDLVKLRSEDLLEICNFGRAKLDLLIHELDRYGISHNFSNVD